MLIHPLLELAASQPHRPGDHLEAYAALAKDELKKVSSGWVVRFGRYAGAGVLVLSGLAWAGVAVLFAAVTPSERHRAGWALGVVPLTPVVIGLLLVLIARFEAIEQPFAVFKEQLKADLAVIRGAVST